MGRVGSINIKRGFIATYRRRRWCHTVGDLNYLGVHTIRNGEAQYSLQMFHQVVNTGYLSDKASPNPAESRMPRKRGGTPDWLFGP